MPTFILNDEKVITSHGFMISNAGGKFERFNANPVMLNAHDDMCVIGRWSNLTIKDSLIKADTEFDVDDPEALKISGKVDRGFIKGASMGIYIEAVEMKRMESGDVVPVVTSWELVEASPVAVPSNMGAVRLYAKDGKPILTSEHIKLSLNNLIKPNIEMEKEKINLTVEAAKVLDVGKQPEETELSAAIMEQDAKLKIALKAQGDAEKALNDHKTEKATQLVELAVKEGKITADKKESFVTLAKTDFKQAEEILSQIPAKQTFSDKVGSKKEGAADREGWTYLKWVKEDSKGLAAMKVNDPAAFEELKANYIK